VTALAATQTDLRSEIRDRLLDEGFDAVGFAPAELSPEVGDRLQSFLAAGRHGDMGWMAERTAQRAHPRGLWPEARTVVVAAANYGPADDPLAVLETPQAGAISVYARHRDYHDLLKKRLKRVARWLAEQRDCGVKIFTDTAPVMEKPLAARAGIGWQGKHTNLVSRAWGSWLFLGEIFLTAELPPDPPETDHCGACRRCLDICPTDAFPAPYHLDARRCISYLTIEHKGPIPRELRPLMGNRIYGCDDCLAVCPWNKFAAPTTDPHLAGRPDLDGPLLAELAALDDAGFRIRFSGSPIKRTGRNRFVRNVLIAIGNSADPGLLPAVRPLLADPDPVVRGAAVWALRRLAPLSEISTTRLAALAAEPDATVRLEWTADLLAAHHADATLTD